MKPLVAFFQDTNLLTHALTHRSYCNEHPGTKSNERLEFLGDSVLSLIISERLFKLLPNLPEGELTSRRSSIVQTTTLANSALELNLNSSLLLSRGEQDLGGRQNPGLLANTFEAVLGALFLDSGIVACKEFLSEVFPDSRLTADFQTKDPKSLLQESSQAKGLGTPIYQTIESTGPDHAKTFTVAVKVSEDLIATGTGASKQKAETEAAKAALDKLFPNELNVLK